MGGRGGGIFPIPLNHHLHGSEYKRICCIVTAGVRQTVPQLILLPYSHCFSFSSGINILTLYLFLKIDFCVFLSISIYFCILLYITYCYLLFLSISIYFYLFLSISIYFYLFLSISIYFYLFLSISIYIYVCFYVQIVDEIVEGEEEDLVSSLLEPLEEYSGSVTKIEVVR